MKHPTKGAGFALAHARRERGLQGMPREATARQPRCADIYGFSLHAAVQVAANDMAVTLRMAVRPDIMGAFTIRPRLPRLGWHATGFMVPAVSAMMVALVV